MHDIVEAEDSRVEAIMCLRKMEPHLLPHQLLDLNFQAARATALATYSESVAAQRYLDIYNGKYQESAPAIIEERVVGDMPVV